MKNETEESRKSAVTSNYEWLKTQKNAWVQGSVMFPVRVDIITVDFEKCTANITTSYQSGTIGFDRLFRYQSECPCR